MTDTLESSACFVVDLCVSWFAAVVMARPYSQIVAASCCLLPECSAHLRSCLEVSEGLLMRLLGSSLDAATELCMI